MLVIENQSHFDNVVAFAREVGLEDSGNKNSSLQNRLAYLEEYGGKTEDGVDRMRVRLLRDPAPMSFYFLIERRDGENWKPFMNGGLLYHGPHDGNGGGDGPTFAVTLEPTIGWSIHT